MQAGSALSVLIPAVLDSVVVAGKHGKLTRIPCREETTTVQISNMTLETSERISLSTSENGNRSVRVMVHQKQQSDVKA